MVTPEEVLSFWLDEVGPKGWYIEDEALDSNIRARFQSTWEAAAEGKFSLWLTYPAGHWLTYSDGPVFTQHVPGAGACFRDGPSGFGRSKMRVRQGLGQEIDEPARQFFYLPMMHSENLCDQERCRASDLRNMSGDTSNLLHARAHREVIRKFGRFPYRNEALSRIRPLTKRLMSTMGWLRFYCA